MTAKDAAALTRENKALKAKVKALTDQLAIQEKVREVDSAIARIPRQRAPLPAPGPARPSLEMARSADFEAFYQVMKVRLLDDAAFAAAFAEALSTPPAKKGAK